MRNQTYLTLLCLCIWAGLFAQSTKYIGVNGGEWSDPANWENNILPGPDHNALIIGGSSVHIGNPLIVDFAIQNYGEIIVEALITNNGNILNEGKMIFTASGGMDNFSTFQNNNMAEFNGAANFKNESGAFFVNSGNLTLATMLESQGFFTNNGTLDAPAGTLLIEGFFENKKVLNTKTLTVLSNTTFTNHFGAHLNINNSGQGILVQGILNNSGTITNEGDLVISNSLTNVGKLLNFGNLEIEAGADFVNNGKVINEETLTNNGLITNTNFFQNKGFFNCFGQFINRDSLINEVGGTVILRPSCSLTLDYGSKILNSGEFDNRGNISSVGNILNQTGGGFSNAGIIDNNVGSVLENDGAFTNSNNIFINDIFRNDGNFTNVKKIEVKTGATFFNSGSFLNQNEATIIITQDFFNQLGALFTNNGFFTVLIRANIDADFINNNLFDNKGDVTIVPSGILSNKGDLVQTSGNILNEGTIDNQNLLFSDHCSTVHNKSLINNNGSFNLQGILFQRGTVTGNSIDVEGGYIHSSATSEAPGICQNGTFGADINGDVKVYAVELVAFENFDSCGNIVYLANGLARPVFACSDIGSVLDVNLTLTTRLGDELTCTAEVTPEDVLAPQFTTPCPEDIHVTTEEATVAISWTTPVAVDNCSITSINSSHDPGDLFSSGNTTVTYTATDASGNEGSCGFNVIVTGLTTCTTNTSPANNAIDVDFSSVTLQWEPSANAILYDVYLGTNNPPTNMVAAGVPATSTTLLNLLGNTVYYWYVIPRNLNGDATGCETITTQFTTLLPCDNVTDAGSIGNDQILCDKNDPVFITSTADASGGSSDLEYIWEKTTTNPFFNNAIWETIPGENTASFDPGTLPETTWLRRGARRNGCGTYLFTFPVQVTIFQLPQPELDIHQPNCTQTLGIASINNLPENAYSRLDGGNPTAGKAIYDNLPVGSHIISIDQNGCEQSTEFEITEFYTAPTAVCKSLERQLDAGLVEIDAAEFDDGSTGTCIPLTYSINGQSILSLSCADVGTNQVVVTVEDILGGTSTCTTSITLKDNGSPTISCKNINVQLDANGNASISPSDVYQGGSDNCGIVAMQSVFPNTFNCSDLGDQSVSLTAKDASGNTTNCTAIVTVKDITPPTVICKNTTVQLNSNGEASISPQDVFEDATDNCGSVTLQSVQPSAFFCGNVGDFTVQLSAQDASGNTGYCNAILTVEDNIPPTVFCKNSIVQLDENGQGSISPQDVFQSASDNCSLVIPISVTPHSFDCGNIGNVVVELKVSDEQGNESSCPATVSVKDVMPPTITCQNITVTLDENGLANINVTDVLKYAIDNCGTVNLESLKPSSFNYASLGQNDVRLTMVDLNSNTVTCNAIVTVEVDDTSVAAYTILTQEEIHVHKNTIYGNVGVWKEGKEGKFHDNSTVYGFLKASKGEVDDKSLLTGEFIPSPAPEPGEFKYNTEPEPESDTKVPDNYPGIYMLQGNNFKKIEIGKNSTAKFMANGEIYIKELKTKDADEGKNTSLLFSGTTELIVRKKIEFGKRTAVNADQAGCVKIYGEEDDVIVKEHSTIYANIDVRFKNLKLDNSKEDKPTLLKGQFIAKKLDGGDFTEWEWQPFPCGAVAGPAPQLLVGGERITLAALSSVNEVDLTWVTNTEDKNERFIIERSGDGLHFTRLFEVLSEKGGQVAVYENKDEAPLRGANFYRVKVIFDDGTSKLSDIRLANIGIDKEALTVFPNPAQHHISMYWDQYAGKTGTVLISNNLGIPVMEQHFDKLPDGPVQLDLGDLPDGLYNLILKVDGFREEAARFMVARMD